MTTYSVIGKATARVEGPQKVTGSAKYAGDVFPQGCLWAKVLRSPYPHANIKSIDITKAESLPGVRAVITGKDVASIKIGRRIKDMPILADGKVRFIGEKVAAVAADSEDIAEEALNLIQVTYEELPAVFDAEEAIGGNAPIVHENLAKYEGLPEPVKGATNIFGFRISKKGDVERAFEQADKIFENTFHTTWVHQAYLEPHACVVDASGSRVRVWASNKTKFILKQFLADTFGIAPESILVHTTHIGGDFGGKAAPMDTPICYLLSKRTGRPVKSVMDYSEEFMASNPRHPTTIYIKTGVKNDGAITALRVRAVFDSGAYGGMKPGFPLGGAERVPGLYRIENTSVENLMVYTNNMPCGYYRAPGDPQGVFAGESNMDIVARAMGFDPAEFRLKNLMRAGDPSPLGDQYKDPKMHEVFSAALEKSGYKNPKSSGIGRGVAISYRGSGANQSNVLINLSQDGRITARCSTPDVGTGTHTIVQQLIAEDLGLSVGEVTVLQVEDTDGVKYDGGIGGSGATRGAGIATGIALKDFKEKAKAIASNLFAWDPVSSRIEKGNIVYEGKSVSIKDLARQGRVDINGFGNAANAERVAVIWCTCQVAEVHVDQETGQVTLRKVTSVHDAGKVLNPTGYEGQVDGGLIQGIGFALMEGILTENGRPLTTNFGDYKIPVMPDIPELNKVILEMADGSGPHGAKPVGEGSIVPIGAAIANAVEDAVGVRIKDLPITAEKVYNALKSNKYGQY